MDDASAALVELGTLLRDGGYRFTTVTPETHRRVNARAESASGRSIEDIFGWSRLFQREVLPEPFLRCMEKASVLQAVGDLFRSLVRFSTAGDAIYAHSAFPTSSEDAVFFGPDTYRFLSLLDQEVSSPVERAVDIGCGSGAGGLHIAGRCRRLVLADINPSAVRFAAINRAISGQTSAEVVRSDVLDNVDGSFDLIISNPPYLLDDASRMYRHGGGSHGEAISVRIVREALTHLAPGGRLILYSGASIRNGQDLLLGSLAPVLDLDWIRFRYFEIDPDVFGEELERPAYSAIERIAAVGLVVNKSG